jgi:hypothetical protein
MTPELAAELKNLAKILFRLPPEISEVIVRPLREAGSEFAVALLAELSDMLDDKVATMFSGLGEKEKLEAFRELCAAQPAMYSRVLAKLTEIRNSAHGKTSRDRTGPDTPSDGSGPAAEAG